MQADNDIVQCDQCGAIVIDKAYQIHKIMCKKNSQSQKQIIKKQNSSPFDKIVNFFTGKEKQPHQQVHPSQVQSMIPCLQCGQSFPFSMYAIHQQQCIGHQLTLCKQCGFKFPTFLMEEHQIMCQGKRNYGQQQVFNIQEEQEPNEEFEHLIGVLALSKHPNKQLDNQKGLTKQQIANLKPGFLKAIEECAICCTPMAMKKRLTRLNCSHIYHHNCITAWLKSHPLCPMCRTHALKK